MRRDGWGMKKFDSQVLKFAITNKKLKMEISLKDLVWLFHNSPNNTYDGESIGCKVKKGKCQEFAFFVVENLMDTSENDDNNTIWGESFEMVFMRIFEGYEDFCKYSTNEEEQGA